MARKGSKKVRTGCLTCKARRVKCDEEIPACKRCTSTGRKCDGYAPSRPAQEIRWVSPDLIVSGTPRQAIGVREARALDFFHHAVAPAISGHVRSEFWTRDVLRMCLQEPAVRHAMLAVSSLYEAFDDVRDRNAFAIQQYNSSIRHMRDVADEAVVLVVCVLMICVECLQGNPQMVIQHCLHGQAILKGTTSRWAQDNLFPIFCRLDILPFLVGGTAAPFSTLGGFEGLTISPDNHTKLEQLQNSLFLLLPPTTRHVQICNLLRADPGRPGLAAALAERRRLTGLFDDWYAAYTEFQRGPTLRGEDGPALQGLEIRWILGVIWVDMALEPVDASYDKHLPKFQRIVELATMAIATTAGRGPRPAFLFEMGFMPLLNLVVVKCRDFCTRVAALNAMRALGSSREGLWDVDVLYAVGRTIIELENGVLIDEAPPLRPNAKKETDAEVRKVMEFFMPAQGPEGKTVAVCERLGIATLSRTGPYSIIV